MSGRLRLRVHLSGAVQGVGFRPFVYRLATGLGLCGWVSNTSEGLTVEAEGPGPALDGFIEGLENGRPAAAVVLSTTVNRLQPAGCTEFEIRSSTAEPGPTAAILPDLATCENCLAELLDPSDRRHLYPFTNCTECGPRQTILLDIPYDRARTTMRGFTMCEDCRREYEDPADRRFEAQPNACPVCGPKLNATIKEAGRMLRSGGIVALKGIGGYQLLTDARSPEAVARLRQRKQRQAKPFAVLMPSLEVVRRYCVVSDEEAKALLSRAAPIVLLRPGGKEVVAGDVRGGSPYLGVMVPYSPLHHLLARECGFPLVATSGNLSEEPIAIDNAEARERLGGVADLYLDHDRPIARPCDDSVVRVWRGQPVLLRRARGYAPLPVTLPAPLPRILAVGGHLKNTVAIGVGSQVFLSPHVGDLESVESRAAFERAIDDLIRLYRFEPELVACDLHPDYASTHWARRSGLTVQAVQHHEAHLAGCAAENEVSDAYLGVCWDGAGYGPDGTVWGGEIFAVEEQRFERVSHPRPFRLPGGEAAIRQGWRAAAALLRETGAALPAGLEREIPAQSRALIERMLEAGINAPVTTSVGRLFDAVAALAGVASESLYEGQAAMMLEGAIESGDDRAYPLPLSGSEADWRPLIETVVADVARGEPVSAIAARFHNALVDWIANVAESTGLKRIVVSGGVFQNQYLAERLACVAEARGWTLYSHRRVPANDGGLALGQAVLAAAMRG